MEKEREYQICTRCVMDTTDPDIVFNAEGICNHCLGAEDALKRIHYYDSIKRNQKLNEIVDEIKLYGRKRKYDCIIGLSGGVDSTYLAYYTVKKLGLNPLAIHLDNGWNSELAVKNIENIVTILNIDLYTHVIDWEEFRKLQVAFLKASVLDLELLTDHAITAVIVNIAKKNNIRHFINGHNYQAESVMPKSWLFPAKHDSLNIINIYKKNNNGKFDLKTYPTFSFINFLRLGKQNLKLVPILNYVDYNKEKAVQIIEKELGWKNYGEKHFESLITKFYQSYILPKKFNIDKRRAHLSSLINSKQISRSEAIKIIERDYSEFVNLEQDLDYFCKKLELSKSEFNRIFNLPIKSHYAYKSYTKRKQKLKKLLKFFKYNGSISKS